MDDRTYIRVHDGMPEHWKIEELSDSAFRQLITLWCWCARQRTDGHVPRRKWLRIGSESDRSELLEAGLVEPADTGDGVVMHDYLEHQRSREDMRKRSDASRKGNHVRHHVNKKRFDPHCDLCVLGDPPPRSDSDSDSPPNRIRLPHPPESQSRSEESRAEERRTDQSVLPNGRAQDAEAARWLASEYGGLTDFVTTFVIAQVRARAGQPIRYLVPYLKAMRDPAKGGDEADLADLIAAGMNAEDAQHPPPPAPPPEFTLITGRPTADDTGPTQRAMLGAVPHPDDDPVEVLPADQAIEQLRAERGWRKTAP